ncbi:MAG: SDR family NAD(P)-dependent oxidoreductase, partial [Komagataeibacter saccharivorans]|uniref:SDR family NAD(P)-dependent oxidoreductase n=1 Tax=Komagataeibacter saccharivorans TaxID=265959 RepID=UPI0039E84C73
MSTSKIALVTGANRGIGYSIARHLTAAGINVIGTYHANADEAKAAETALSQKDAKLRMLQLDIANHASFTDFAGQVKT